MGCGSGMESSYSHYGKTQSSMCDIYSSLGIFKPISQEKSEDIGGVVENNVSIPDATYHYMQILALQTNACRQGARATSTRILFYHCIDIEVTNAHIVYRVSHPAPQRMKCDHIFFCKLVRYL